MPKDKPFNDKYVNELVTGKANDHMEAKAIAIKSIAQADCPVLHNNLRSSAAINKIGTKIYISFGDGISRKYSVRQHEDITLHHKVGHAKFLQNAFLKYTSGMKKK